MSRPLRFDHPGAVWHVTARGNEKREIFRDDDDRHEWIRVLGEAVELFQWRLHAYVQMGNHYHAIVETPAAGLPAGMRHLNGVYTQRFNRRHDRVGHLFQGRYHAVLVQKETHALELARYVVLNPVRAGIAITANDWRWSSYRATAGEARAPEWLETAWTLDLFGSGADARERYRSFVGEGRGARSPWTALRGQIYLGTDAFVAAALRRAAGRPGAPEVPRPQREMARHSESDVLDQVLAALAVGVEELHQHPREHRQERMLLAYGLRRFAGASGSAIGAVLNVSSWHASALSRAGAVAWCDDPRVRAVLAPRAADPTQQT